MIKQNLTVKSYFKFVVTKNGIHKTFFCDVIIATVTVFVLLFPWKKYRILLLSINFTQFVYFFYSIFAFL